MTQPERINSRMYPECVVGTEREAAECLLAELHGELWVVLDGEAQDFIDFPWARGHIDLPRNWVEHLHLINACLPVTLAGGRGKMVD